ncbi:hypothetical protein Tco_1495242 [Tanacetum coccineum]
MEYAANEERQLLEKVAELLAGSNVGKKELVTTVVNGLRETVAELRVILKLMFLRPVFKSSTPDYLLFTKLISNAPKSVTDDIKKYADVVYVSGFTIETFSMMPDFYSDPYTELISFIAAGISGAITYNPKTASAFMRNPFVDPNSTASFVYMPI